MIKRFSHALAGTVAALVLVPGLAIAEDAGHHEIPRQNWSISRFTPHFDKPQLHP
jgi:hypothetical protein